MERTEKQRKLQLLKEFCAKSEIPETEMKWLYNELAYANTEFECDIYYADGTVSRKIELEKEPLAIKMSGGIHNWEPPFWLSLKTTFPNQMTENEALAYIKNMPCIEGKECRLPKKYEMDIVIHQRGRFLEAADRLRSFFCLPKFCSIGQGDPDGRFMLFGTSYEGEQVGHCPYFPGVYYSPIEPSTKLLWWPVCDAD